jgi:alkanesulfonate monooxygenase SsuD/methylene tetrahydromethanopterin reductase-like flavin-dependent oxidoreductase (luciferase family)
MVYSAIPSIKKIFDEYRECARRAGYEAPPGQFGWMTLIYVAETDGQARAEAEPHALWLFGRGLKNPPEYLFPPGYMTVPSMLRQIQMKDKLEFGKKTFRELEDEGYVVAGSPETVAQRIRAVHAELGFGIMTGLLQFGPMPHDQTVKSMELFARKVMPQLRPL